MEEDEALAILDQMRIEIDAYLEALIEEKSQIYGEVAIRSGEVLLAGGKRLRPIMVLLAYEIAGGQNPEEVMPLALAFELIHTATLVHDDINDQADTRRGQPTIHSQAGEAKAIIAGDWLFVQGFGLGGRYREEVVDVMANCCAQIASSEFHQLDHIMDLTTTPEDYLEVVKGKTAGPFSAGCEGAVMIAGKSKLHSDALANFGLELGVAFQLVDDLLDIKGDMRMGKPRGADVYEGKMTLPLIHALTLLHSDERVRLGAILADFKDEYFEELIELLQRSDSLSYVEILVENHLERAMESLKIFDESEAKNLMKYIVSKVGSRHY
jgi:geranylgeranyl pyrophosphate synthase